MPRRLLLLTSGAMLVWAGTALAAPPQVVETISVESPKSEPLRPLLADQSPKPNKTGRPYRASCKTRHPLVRYEEKGIACWYGPSFHGRRTSSGEVFDMYKLSAAHKLLPMHTKISVTNLDNGKSLTLAVNDRGPFVPGRVLDLSYGAAKTLGMVDRGHARILIRASGAAKREHTGNPQGEFCVHVGSFDAKADALLLLEDMKLRRYKASLLKIARVRGEGKTRWKVEVGPYNSVSEAYRAKSTVVQHYPSAFVTVPE